MAKEALLVNPRRRSRKRRTAAQKRATRKMIAANRRRARGGRRRRNLTIETSAQRAARGANPRRRRRNYYVSNPHRRRRRRNPNRRMTLQGVMNNLVVPAATAGAGAVLLDVLWGFVPVPPNIKTGPMRHVAKGIGAVTLGWLVGQVATRRMGDTMAMGALTVVFHSAFREMTAQFAPQIPLGYYSAGMPVGYDPSLGIYIGPEQRIRQVQTPSMPQNEMAMYVPEGEGYWP